MSVTGESSTTGKLSDMTDPERFVAKDLKDLHGIKSVVQSRKDFSLVITAHDDYPVLSHLQTVCAWHASTFSVESAGRVDGDIVVRAKIQG